MAEQTTPAADEPKGVVDAAKEIATDSIHKSAEIVEGAADIAKGNIGGGIGRIIKSATDIATNAASKGTKLVADQLGTPKEK